jgi:hypothetical protein
MEASLVPLYKPLRPCKKALGRVGQSRAGMLIAALGVPAHEVKIKHIVVRFLFDEFMAVIEVA